jgi:cholesterol transport system auxiliary component
MINLSRTLHLGAVSICVVVLIAGCASLARRVPPATLYGLGQSPSGANRTQTEHRTGGPVAPILIVGIPHAAAGFDSARIVYVRGPDQRRFYANSEWIDTPSRLLSPLIVTRIADGGSFRAVVAAPSAVAVDLRLDTEIVLLQQEFGANSSQVRLHIRAYLVVERSRRLIAWKDFEATVPAESEDAAGAVRATQKAVRTILTDLEAFCALNVASWRPDE